MKNVSQILFIFVSLAISAQTKIHQGDGTFLSNKVLLTIIDNQFLNGDKSGKFPIDDIIYTIQGDKIIEGFYNSAFDEVVYSFHENKIRKGGNKFLSNKVIYTIIDNKILKGEVSGKSYFSEDVLYTIDGRKIRKGDGTFLSNTILYTIEGEITNQQLLLTLVILEN